MSRTLWLIGGLGSMVVVAAAVSGFLLKDTSDPNMPRHVLVALAGTLAASFCHFWATAYLFGLGRAVAATVAEGGLEAIAVATARRLRRRALVWILPALLLTLALFGLGGPTLTGVLPAPAHQALAWGALLLQVGALWQERRAVGGTERLLRGAAESRA